jgi:glycine betaine transporter
VPIDFSVCSLKALRYGVPFAERFGADIYLLNVIEPGPFNDLASMPIMVAEEELRKDAQQRLLNIAENEIEELLPVNAQVRSGHAAHEIVELAKILKIDLIILGTHGHTGLKRAVMGSTTEQVVRQAHCPVFVVREVEREFVSQQE